MCICVWWVAIGRNAERHEDSGSLQWLGKHEKQKKCLETEHTNTISTDLMQQKW